MNKFFIKTLGCKTNQIESELMREQLEGCGFEYCRDEKMTDVYILNSCTVTSLSDNDALRILRKQKKDNPSCVTVLTGCFAQLEAKKLSEIEFVDVVLGNSEKMEISKHIQNYLNTHNKLVLVDDIFEQKDFIFKKIANPTKTRAGLKIQDGCNNACSYCAIRLARGKSRSNPVENIIEQANIYAKHGFHEIIITGINIGQWGPDLAPSKTTFDLIDALDSTKIERFRLGSLNPNEISEKLLDRLALSEKFCPHFHLSLQSACNKTLREMNRTYTAELFLEQIDMMREKFSHPFIGSDIITGFPNESDEDFEETFANLANSGLTTAHVFPYSIRENTIAATMPNQVPQAIKVERAERLKAEMKKHYNRFVEENINDFSTLHRVGIEKKLCSKTGMYKGITENYLTVHIPNSGANVLCNTMQSCKLTACKDGVIIAEVIE